MKKRFILCMALMFVMLLSPNYIFGMHIMEGFLPVWWALFWTLVSLPFVILGLRAISKTFNENPNQKLLFALVTAFVFILSALKMPSVTGSTSHPTGTGLGAILFGPMPMAVSGLIVLLFQALLLAHGGISTLGANVFSMAVVGPFVAYFTYKLLKGTNKKMAVFLAAALGDLLTYVVTSLQLALAHPDAVGGVMGSLTKFLSIFAVTQIPLAIAEGILSVIVFDLIVNYQKKGDTNLKESTRNILLILVLIVMVTVPLLTLTDAEFGGADGQAEETITEINPDYEPWFSPLIEPASGEIESLLFSLQAAIGAGFIGYFYGFVKGKRVIN